MISKHYKIADHIVTLKADESSSIWDNCSNYEPFRVPEDTVIGKSVCELEIVNTFEIPEAKTVLDVARPGFPRLHFSHFDGGWVLGTAPECDIPITIQIVADEEFKSAKMVCRKDDAKLLHFAVDNALMIMFAITTATLGTLEIHSSVTVCDGKAYAFLGKSGTGKSTHSRLWREHISGCELLNDDNPIIRVLDDEVRIYGSPWSGKTPCYKNESYPLGAIVRLEQAPENRIKRMNIVEAYASMFSSCSAFRKVPETADGIHSTLSRLVQMTPVFHLECLPDAEAAELCHSTVAPK